MKTEEDGRALAEKMVAIGKRCGRNTAALITNMDVPLGNAVGNSLEVLEAEAVLKGKQGDLREVCVALSSNLLALCHGISLEEARSQVEDALNTGKALERFYDWIEAQGGARDLTRLPQAEIIAPVHAPRSGFLSHMDAEQVGMASCILGAGRMKKEDVIDHGAGIYLTKKTGDFVHEGEVLAYLHTNREEMISDAEDRFLCALTWSDTPPAPQNLIFGAVR